MRSPFPTSLANGRKIFLAHSIYYTQEKWTTPNENVWDVVEDIGAAVYFSTALAAFIIPDPNATLVGWLLPAKTPQAILLLTGIKALEDLGYFGDEGFFGEPVQGEYQVGSDILDEFVRNPAPGNLPINFYGWVRQATATGNNLANGLTNLLEKMTTGSPLMPSWGR